MSKTVDLSIIIPAYREAKTIGASLEEVAAVVKSGRYGVVEVVVVVPDSPDGTAAIAHQKSPLFEHYKVIDAGPRVGKGRDVRIGVFEASGRYKLFMDADLATPLSHLDDVKRLMDAEVPVGIAVRDLVSIHKDLVRRVISKFGNILAQVVLLPGIKDTQCGFKFFEAAAAAEIFGRQTITGWGFDLEILAIARKLGYHVATIAVPDWKDPKVALQLAGDSAGGAALQVFKDLFLVRINLIRGRYNRLSFHYEPPHAP